MRAALQDLLVIVLLAVLIVSAAGGCGTRRPGQSWPWAAEHQTRSVDGVTDATIGIGIRL